jgi:hypothetical protein
MNDRTLIIKLACAKLAERLYDRTGDKTYAERGLRVLEDLNS